MTEVEQVRPNTTTAEIQFSSASDGLWDNYPTKNLDLDTSVMCSLSTPLISDMFLFCHDDLPLAVCDLRSGMVLTIYIWHSLGVLAARLDNPKLPRCSKLRVDRPSQFTLDIVFVGCCPGVLFGDQRSSNVSSGEP